MKVSERKGALDRAKLYLVAPGELPLDLLQSVIEAGVDVVQLRMKDADAAEIIEIGDQFRGECERANVLFVVNDRPDIALALGADGVHLGQDDVPPAVARDIVGPDVVIGRSTHSIDDIERARQEHGDGVADYIAVGPVYETPTAPGRPGVGLDLLGTAAETVGFPWFAIGGINPRNVGGIVEAGARRIVVVRAITEAADPIGAVEQLRAALR
ncbi:MAG TPA: thiamine phosphate synthase [Actinomycetota bacterium]|jgi:thiamine-phosphate pyrophosphorylase|nr:thiamine phosphate synthase [Actinomycetota bacterium]